ncbi:MAG: beta-ketoacyl synthase N-terminal-like domain-containing protein [Pseudomonadota bacterium]
MCPKDVPEVFITGVGAVAPNGVGVDFVRGLHPGAVGIRPINRHYHRPDDGEKDLMSTLRESFTRAMAQDVLIHQWREIRIPAGARSRGLSGIAWVIHSLGFPVFAEAGSRTDAEILQDMADSDAFKSGGAYIPQARAPIRTSIRGGPFRGKPRDEHVDAAAFVPATALLPWLMPLSALLFERVSRRAGDLDTLALDAIHLTLPRATELALVSTFLGLLDVFGDLRSVQAEIDEAAKPLRALLAGAGCGRDPDTVVRAYLQASLEIVRPSLKTIQGKVEGGRTGLLVGCSTGSGDAFARFIREVAFSGLIPAPVSQGAAPGDGQVTLAALDATALCDLAGSFNHANHNAIAGLLCELFHTEGEQLTLATACCSGQVALTTAARFLATALPGMEAERMVVTGVDACLSPEFLAGFSGARVLASLETVPGATPPDQAYADLCQPFRQSAAGWVMGEGAGTVVIERRPRGSHRSEVRISAASLANAAHRSPRDKNFGKFRVLGGMLHGLPPGPGLALGFALGCRRLDPLEIGVVNAVSRRLQRLYLASIKEWTGHSMAGSSILAAVAAYHALQADEGLRVLPRMRNVAGKLFPTDPTMGGPGPIAYLPPVLKDDQLPTWAVLNGSGLGGTAAALRLERDA